jgi:hypothetical protein
MSRPFNPPWFDHPNNNRWRGQIMEFFILQFSPAYCHFIHVDTTVIISYLK